MFSMLGIIRVREISIKVVVGGCGPWHPVLWRSSGLLQALSASGDWRGAILEDNPVYSSLLQPLERFVGFVKASLHLGEVRPILGGP